MSVMKTGVTRYKLDTLCAVGGAAVGILPSMMAHPRSGWQFASFSLAYSSVALLGMALLVGPARVLKGYGPLLSSRLRRHLGIWSGIFALGHVTAGLNVHFKGHIRSYFLEPPSITNASPLRLDAFGIVNDLGLLATLIVILLLALSNDKSLVAFGPNRWKKFQRLTYLFSLLVILHGYIYQIMEKRSLAPLVLISLVYITVIVFQIWGQKHVIRRGLNS